MNPNQVADEAARLAENALDLASHARTLAMGVSQTVAPDVDPFIFLLAIFLMAFDEVRHTPDAAKADPVPVDIRP